MRIKKVVSSEKRYSKFENQTKYLTTTCISFTVTVKVKDGQTTATNFKGVLLQARKGSSPDTATYYGTWDVLSSDLKTINCGSGSTVSVKSICICSLGFCQPRYICNRGTCTPTRLLYLKKHSCENFHFCLLENESSYSLILGLDILKCQKRLYFLRFPPPNYKLHFIDQIKVMQLGISCQSI